MKNYFILIIFFCFCFVHLFAQTTAPDQVILKSNDKFSGEIIFQNEEVIIIKQEEGNRFQFPLTDVKSIYKAGEQIYPVQENEISYRKIVLNTGDIYYGEILVENEQLVMIKTPQGTRFQFPRSEIRSIDENFEAAEIPNTQEDFPIPEDNKFVMSVEASAGASYSKLSYGWTPSLQGTVILGGRDLFLPNTFLGIGAGYHVLFTSDYSDEESISFIPVFARFQYILSQSRVAPYVEMDAGYGFAPDSDFEGGMILKLSAGIAYKLSYHTSLNFGLYAGLQNFSADLSKDYDWGKYNYYGNTTAFNFGAKVCLKF